MSVVATSGTSAARRPARWPWIAVASFVAMAGVALSLVVRNGEPIAEQAGFTLAFGLFGVVGALILSRDGRNLIGWLLIYGSAMTAVAFLGGELTTTLVRSGRTGPLVGVIALLGNVGWLIGIVPSLFLLILVFPDGRLPSPRWRPVAWFIAANILLVLASETFGRATWSGSSEDVTLENPFVVPAIARAIGWVSDAGWTFLVIFALAISSLIVRFRRSRGIERQQIRWFVAAAGFAFGSALFSELLLAVAPQLVGIDSILSAIAFLTIPIAIGVAVLRYHLFDLDVVIRKTLVYALFVVFATLVYAAVVVGAGAWLGRDNSLLTMIAAVVVAVTFQPVRDRLTHLANRLVYGRRATPYEVLADFAERVGATYGDEDVLARMARVLGEGVGAERADVFLKVDDTLRDVAVWPGEAAPRPPMSMANGALPAIAEAERVYAVEHAGELLGALAIRKPTNDPVSPADEKLVEGLAAQAGLVLRNVRLTEELRARLADLRAAQKRLVSAQDEERRRLERNIHDGAQQQLVALAVKARLARSLTKRDPAKAADMLGQIEAETQTALEDLRDLARGIYPPLLADKGLAAAIAAQARKAAMSVEVRADGLGRYPADAEAAVYFSCLEALQNAAKYAEARHVVVTLAERAGRLTFIVADDGRGFDPAATGYGTGLQGIEDRLVAIDGTLAVQSAPGEGTIVEGAVPIGLPMSAPSSPREDRAAPTGAGATG